MCMGGGVLAGARDIGSPWSCRCRYLWVLDTELSPSTRAVSALNCEASLQPLEHFLTVSMNDRPRMHDGCQQAVIVHEGMGHSHRTVDLSSPGN